MSTKTTSSKHGGLKFGQMVASMKGSGKTVKRMEKAISGTQMEILMKANGWQIKLMVKVCIYMLMERDTLVFGRMMFSTERGRKPGLTDQVFRETMSMVKSMAREFINGLTALVLVEDGLKIKSMVLVFISGLTVVDLRVTGKITTCTDEAIILGLTVEATKGSILMIKNMARVSTPGQMVDNIMVNGYMVDSMDKGCTDMLMELQRLASGRKANA
jgi:hypothetical protein